MSDPFRFLNREKFASEEASNGRKLMLSVRLSILRAVVSLSLC